VKKVTEINPIIQFRIESTDDIRVQTQIAVHFSETVKHRR